MVAVLGAAAVKFGDAPAVLRRHGIDPATGVVGLTAALAERGWAVRLEEGDGGLSVKSARRWRALAMRPRPPRAAPMYPAFSDHVQGRGRIEAEALARALAAALKRDEG